MSVDDIICKLIEQEDDFSDINLGGAPPPETNESWHIIARHALARYYGRHPSTSEFNGFVDRLTEFMISHIEDEPEEFVDCVLNQKHNGETFFWDMANVLLGPRE